MILVGVTGGIGAGKTTVLECVRDLGADTVDADDEVHRLYRPGQDVYQAVLNRWGRDILTEDRTVDRLAVARIVFRDRNELAWLNDVIHPVIRKRFLEYASLPDDRLLFCGVPLLYEKGWTDLFRSCLAVWCDTRTQRRRLRQRGWSDKDIDSRTALQMNMDDKLMRADYGLVNTGSPALLRSQCECIYERLRARLHA